MALENFARVTDLGGYKVANMDEIAKNNPEFYEESGQMNWKWFEANIRPTHFVMVRPDVNSITFTLESETVKGCKIETMIEAAKHIAIKKHEKTKNNNLLMAIGYLNDAIQFLKFSEDNSII